MLPDEPDIIRSRLEHMLEAVDAIGSFLTDVPRDSMSLDLKTRWAIAAAFIRLGEAANRIPAPYRDAHPDLPWAEIRQYRNFMVHAYDMVDDARMLGVARDAVPPLRDQLADMLRNLTP